MGLSSGFDASESLRARPVGQLAGTAEERDAARAGVLALGTLACPSCDAPVLPVGAVSPQDAIGCAFCGHGAAVRDFLSLAAPTRPARVQVRVVLRARRLVRR